MRGSTPDARGDAPRLPPEAIPAGNAFQAKGIRPRGALASPVALTPTAAMRGASWCRSKLVQVAGLHSCKKPTP